MNHFPVSDSVEILNTTVIPMTMQYYGNMELI